MVYSYIHNLKLLHVDHSDLLIEEEKSIYQFLIEFHDRVEKILSSRPKYDNAIYHRLLQGDYLFLYANDTLTIPVQFVMVNVRRNTLETEIQFDRLKPLCQEREQNIMWSELTKLNKQLTKQEVFPELNERLHQRAIKTKSVHVQNYRGWDKLS